MPHLTRSAMALPLAAATLEAPGGAYWPGTALPIVYKIQYNGTGTEAGDEHRVFYVAAWEEGIYVLHAFSKKAGRTAAHDLELGRARYGIAAATREGVGRHK